MSRVSVYAITVLLVCTGLSGCGKRVLIQPSADMSHYSQVAILPFETDSFLSTLGHQMADELLVVLLEKAPQLNLVERSRIADLLQEQKLSKEGYLSMESAIQVGRLLGVRAIVTGSITVSIGDVRPTPLSPQRIATGVATIRFIDTETGKIIWAKREQSQYAVYTTTVDGQSPYSDKTDHEMMQTVVQELGQLLAKPFFSHYEIQY
jgi:TolB-like protein